MNSKFPKVLLSLAAISIAMTGCLEKRSKEPNIELTQDMMKDPSFKAQDYDLDKTGKRANMLPPPGTNPMNWTPYPGFKNDEEAKDFKNTLVPNKEILARGERKYQIYCAVCHGTQGYGDGTVAEKTLVKPPSLQAEKIRGWTDGQINHLITKGRGLMGGYESQIPSQEDRWALVHYIRHMQKTLPAAGENHDHSQHANEGK
jgi:mono/diheme cytochrome c family protein